VFDKIVLLPFCQTPSVRFKYPGFIIKDDGYLNGNLNDRRFLWVYKRGKSASGVFRNKKVPLKFLENFTTLP